MSNAAVPAPASKSLTALLDKLREMFQFDGSDLDFGIYRIMNFRPAEIDAYLARELPAQVRDALEAVAAEDSPTTLKTAIAKSCAIRDIAKKIIAFHAQIEDFQKKLWLKKKFGIETPWCVALDRVPEDLYQQIAVNEDGSKEGEGQEGEDTPSEDAAEAPAQWKVRPTEDGFHGLMFCEDAI